MDFMQVIWRTALLLHGTPDLVHTDKYTVNYICFQRRKERSDRCTNAKFIDVVRCVSQSGLSGF
jgi:hypothetical protein